MMLLADRFAIRAGSLAEQDCALSRSMPGLDLATGSSVRLCIDPAGTRAGQEAWVEKCASAHEEGILVDFGFLGKDRRFEAVPLAQGDVRTWPSAVHVMDWLEHRPVASTGILSVLHGPDPRELRIRGFVPLDLACVDNELASEVLPLVERRSVVLLAASTSSTSLSLALLRLRRANARDVCALSGRISVSGPAGTNAAEGRAAYEPKPTVASSRAGGMLDEGERLFAAGRHAGADRVLRAAIGAFERRGDLFRAGGAEMMLGRLLLTRGRAADAQLMFESAHDRFQRARVPAAAVTAMSYRGVAETDLARLEEAERSCRAAYSAAAASGDSEMSTACAVSLARALSSQERYSDAQSVLDSVRPSENAETAARYWCLAAKIRLAGGGVADARRALEKARPRGQACVAAIESLVRTREAAVQALVGDLEALSIHVRAGLAAARAAHLPLQAFRLRLLMVDGLVAADRLASARAAAAGLRGISRSSIPPLLKRGLDRTLARVNATADDRDRLRGVRVRESARTFQPRDYAGSVSDIDGLRELLSCSHQFEDEAEGLTHAAASIRRHAHAVGVGIFGCSDGGARLFGAAGSSDQALALRSFNAGIPIGPEPSSGWVDAAMPIRYLGRFIGVLAIRWTTEGPGQVDRAKAFGMAAAAACAPLVYVMLERRPSAVHSEAPFDLVGVSAAMEDVRRAIARAASAPFTVLIEGETGSGKELVARAIHRAGCRRERRFCAFNCAAMPEDLVDTELFGHAKGAFTGAAIDRLGLFESADGGTVFLDEVGELSPRAQAKVLRVLQEGEVRRIGESVSRTFDARLIAATNRSLPAEAEAGRFRQDLLYRLDVIRIHVPPLRQRVEDIPLLAARCWKEAAARINSRAVLGQSALLALARYDWPGNVRELQNVLTALVVAAPPRGVVGASRMPAAIAFASQQASDESLEDARLKFEQRFVRAALARAAGHRGRTAAALGLSRQGLAKLMQRLHLDA